MENKKFNYDFTKDDLYTKKIDDIHKVCRHCGKYFVSGGVHSNYFCRQFCWHSYRLKLIKIVAENGDINDPYVQWCKEKTKKVKEDHLIRARNYQRRKSEKKKQAKLGLFTVINDTRQISKIEQDNSMQIPSNIDTINNNINNNFNIDNSKNNNLKNI